MILLNKKLDQSFRITFSLVFGSGGNVFYFKNTVSFVCYDTLTLDSIIVKYDIEEMLPLKDVPKLIGYNAKTIQRWAHQKTLKTVWHQNHLFTTRDWLIDFLATEGYKVQNKSLLHTRLLLQYYNQ